MLILLHRHADEVSHLFHRNGHLPVVALFVLPCMIVHEPELRRLPVRMVLQYYCTLLIISQIRLARVCKKHVGQSGLLNELALAAAYARQGLHGRVRQKRR